MNDITITLYRNVLLHHIGQVAYKEGFVINTGDDKARSDVQDVASDDETIARLTYSLETAWSMLTAILAKVIKSEPWTGGAASSDTFTERTEFVTVLEWGDEHPRPIVDALMRAMHDYMVFYALSQWFVITKPEKVPYYEGLAEEAKNNVSDFASRDGGPLLIRPWPPLAL